MAWSTRVKRAVSRSLFWATAQAAAVATLGAQGTDFQAAGKQLRDACAGSRLVALSLTKGDTEKFPYLTEAKSEEIAQLSAEKSLQQQEKWRFGGDYSRYVMCLFSARVRQISLLPLEHLEDPPAAPAPPPPPLLRRGGGDGTDLLSGTVSGSIAPAPPPTSGGSNGPSVLGAVLGGMAQAAANDASIANGSGSGGSSSSGTSGSATGSTGTGSKGTGSSGTGNSGTGKNGTGSTATRSGSSASGAFEVPEFGYYYRDWVQGQDATGCLRESGVRTMMNYCTATIHFVRQSPDGTLGGGSLPPGGTAAWPKEGGVQFGACYGINSIVVPKKTQFLSWVCQAKPRE